MDDRTDQRKRILLLMPPGSYRADAFCEAAARSDIDVVKGIDLPRELAEQWHAPLKVDFRDPAGATREIVRFAQETPIDAILAVDDGATVIAAEASKALGLPNNLPEAALATRDKYRMRQLLAAAGVPSPEFRRFQATENPAVIAETLAYPCVVKPLHLNASRGVIRADNPEQFVRAFGRLRNMLRADGNAVEETFILVERFVPGFEVALDGLVSEGKLDVLVLFDKPDPLDGPFFEETIYVTPSRLPMSVQSAIADCAAGAAAALGLRHGPVHAELRVNETGPWIVEIASRSIGGLCSTVLHFGTGMSLEDIILRHAVGLPVGSLQREQRAAGVMMIPIPRAGILRAVRGIDEARQVPGIDGVEITAKPHHRLVPLPEGASYLGFIFARGGNPDLVEAALREAHAQLKIDVMPELPMLDSPSATATPPGY